MQLLKLNIEAVPILHRVFIIALAIMSSIVTILIIKITISSNLIGP